MMENEMHRLNVRVNKDLNDWLDAEADETGLSKSTIMMLAAEAYRKDKEAFSLMQSIQPLMDQIEEITHQFEGRIAKLEKELKKAQEGS